MFQAIEFRTPSVVFGMDAVLRIGKEAKRLGGHRVLVVTGPRIKGAGLPEKALSCLKAEKLDAEVIVQERDTPEPATSVVEEVTDFARQGGFDLIVGLGGGSILDVAKMASALLTNPGKTTDYFGREKVLHRGKPTIILPTTSGTGAEVTKHAIFLDRESNVKKAVASTNLLPDGRLVQIAEAMGEPVAGLAEREAADRTLAAIRHLMKSVDLPVCLEEAGIADRSRIPTWAVEAHKEQRLLSRSARILSVKDIERIYEKAFTDWGEGR